jgi:hypothetical protein
LIFQTIDRKKECHAVYYDERIQDSPVLDNNLNMTWSYSSQHHRLSEKIEYANIRVSGKSLDEVCPEDLQLEWQEACDKLEAFNRSFSIAKINIKDVCYYELIPEKFIVDYCKIKNKITDYVFQNYEKPKNYDFLLDLTKVLEKIKKKPLNVTPRKLDFANQEVRKSYGKINSCAENISYNVWGTVTGRLTTKKNSFPILTLNKPLRKAITPQNDIFVELDFNAAEVRALFGLLNKKQPPVDIHNSINQNVFDSKYSREQSKRKFFAWLYNHKASNKKLSQYIDKKLVLDKFYDGDVVENPFGRVMPVGEKNALNYLIQSTASDIFLRSMIRVDNLLKDSQSYIAFCVHDSLVLDMKKEEKDLLHRVVEAFSKTMFGDFKINISIGKDFGSMRKVR